MGTHAVGGFYPMFRLSQHSHSTVPVSKRRNQLPLQARAWSRITA